MALAVVIGPIANGSGAVSVEVKVGGWCPVEEQKEASAKPWSSKCRPPSEVTFKVVVKWDDVPWWY